MHAQRLAPQAFQAQILAQIGKLVFKRLRANAGQLVGIEEQRRQLLPGICQSCRSRGAILPRSAGQCATDPAHPYFFLCMAQSGNSGFRFSPGIFRPGTYPTA